MIQGIDHTVIAVRDLSPASTDDAKLGVIVTPGGEHTGGPHITDQTPGARIQVDQRAIAAR